MSAISTKKLRIVRLKLSGGRKTSDVLAVEEPLEIRIASASEANPNYESIAITMRTPGNDFELAAGFLVSEGVIRKEADIREIAYCVDPDEPQQFNIVNILLAKEVRYDLAKLSRNIYTTSSCGICGKASLELVQQACPQKPVGDFQLSADFFSGISGKMATAQPLFAETGGLHGAALFDLQSELICSAEDVGRHNAVDKLVGKLLFENALPASNHVLLLSGRAGFELVQKAILAGIPLVAAVGAPSSLAVSLAKSYHLTLIGFLRDRQFNIYAGEERVLY